MSSPSTTVPATLPCPACSSACPVTTYFDMVETCVPEPPLLQVRCRDCGETSRLALADGRVAAEGASCEVRGLRVTPRPWGLEISLKGRTWRFASS